MKTISIRELHRATGHWVRRAAQGEVEVTDRGKVVARLVAAAPEPEVPYFARRRLPASFWALQKKLEAQVNKGTDATQIISEDRDGR